VRLADVEDFDLFQKRVILLNRVSNQHQLKVKQACWPNGKALDYDLRGIASDWHQEIAGCK